MKELTYIVYTVNQSKHKKIKEGRDEIWHIPCELITRLKAIAECQVKNSQFLRTNIWEPNLKNCPNQITRTRMDTTCTKTSLTFSGPIYENQTWRVAQIKSPEPGWTLPVQKPDSRLVCITIATTWIWREKEINESNIWYQWSSGSHAIYCWIQKARL
jgi:hypothetical protein